jgi:hypothetical protein
MALEWVLVWAVSLKLEAKYCIPSYTRQGDALFVIHFFSCISTFYRNCSEPSFAKDFFQPNGYVVELKKCTFDTSRHETNSHMKDHISRNIKNNNKSD